jgi:hypothetical protein
MLLDREDELPFNGLLQHTPVDGKLPSIIDILA